jgi:two-component system, NarL family, sensor histidine kinase DesK
MGAVTGLLVDAPPFFLLVAVVITLLVGSVNLHYSQQGRAQSKLRLAHEEIEQLAAIAERERIARDLHDVLGHTLSLIVLKAELAVKLSAIDPERAAREMHDVEDVARRTLQDVRLAIRGYRTTLPEEMDRARSMLKAARISGDIAAPAVRLSQNVEEALALVLREAVTNVVRHSGASRCSTSVSCDDGFVTLDVRDDGRGTSAAPGLGLRGIRERIEFMGGTVRINGSRGMHLSASLPLETSHSHSHSHSDAHAHAHAHAQGAERGDLHDRGVAP